MLFTFPSMPSRSWEIQAAHPSLNGARNRIDRPVNDTQGTSDVGMRASEGERWHK